MFEKFEVDKFHLVLGELLALYGCGWTTGMVINSGYEMTNTVPIYEGYPLYHAVWKMHVGGKHSLDTLLWILTQNVRNMTGMKHCVWILNYRMEM